MFVFLFFTFVEIFCGLIEGFFLFFFVQMSEKEQILVEEGKDTLVLASKALESARRSGASDAPAPKGEGGST